MTDLAIKIHFAVIDDDEELFGQERVVFDVVEPETGYLVERFHDLMRAVRWSASPICQRVFYGYPHPGCAEFAPPDEIPCGANATTRIEYVDGWTYPGEDPHSVMYLCDRCADEFRTQDSDETRTEITSDDPL